VLSGQKRVREVPEELLQEAGNTIDVVEEVLGIPKIEIARGRIYRAVSGAVRTG